jgi:hypothetical protein
MIESSKLSAFTEAIVYNFDFTGRELLSLKRLNTDWNGIAPVVNTVKRIR